jgi:uncharacterized protein YndB with AHSA1/START domain
MLILTSRGDLMVIKVLVVLAVLMAGFFIYVAVQPSEYLIARETVVKASPEAIFPHINNSKKMNDWMPWKEHDPQVVTTFSGPEEGVGSTSSWNSPGQMGEGEAVVLESQPNKLVKTRLSNKRPFKMEQLAEVSLEPVAEGTKVRWAVSGNNTFMGRLMCVFINMDKMIGGQFEKGLSNLKATVEAGK